MTSTTNKTISNTKFDMIVPGMYFSEDKKGVIINVFVFTKMYGNSDKDAVSAELNKCLDENAPEFKDSVECLIFKTGELGKFWEKGSILVDADKAVSVFSNLKTIVFSDEIKINNAPDSIRLIGRYELEDAGYSEEKNGDMEKAEFIEVVAVGCKLDLILTYVGGNGEIIVQIAFFGNGIVNGIAELDKG